MVSSFTSCLSLRSLELFSRNFWKILLPCSARIFWTPETDFNRLGVVRILRQTCILWTLFTSCVFFYPLSNAQMIKDDSTDILLNFLIFRFFFDLIASLVSEIPTQLARKSSSESLRDLRSGMESSPFWSRPLAACSSRLIVSVP